MSQANSSNVVDSLFVSLGINLDDKGFKKAQDQVNGLKSGLIQLGAAAGAAVGFQAFTHGIANKVNDLNRIARITRFTTKEVEALNHALRNVGVFDDNAGGGIAQRVEQLQRAVKDGTINAKAYFGAGSNFSPEYFAQLEGIKAVEYLVKSYSGANHLGQSWIREGLGIGPNEGFTQLLEMGPEKFQDALGSFRDNYVDISPELTESAEKFNKELADLKLNFDNLQKTMGDSILPYFNKFLNMINSFAKENPDAVEAGVYAGGLLGATGALSLLKGGGKSLLGLISVGGRMIPIIGASTAAYYGSGFLGDGLNTFFGDSDYFQRIRTAQTWGDFGAALAGEGDASWNNGVWVDNRGTDKQISSNARKYLSRLAAAEGTAKKPNNGYSTLFGGSQFADFSDHPRQFFKHNGTITSAAGRYQITASSWDDARKALDLKDFSPANQDQAAMWLARRAGQGENIESGHFYAADRGLDNVWTGLRQYTRGGDVNNRGGKALDYAARAGNLAQFGNPTDSYPSPSVSRTSAGSSPRVIQSNDITINAKNADAGEVVDLLMNELSNQTSQATAHLSTDKF